MIWMWFTQLDQPVAVGTKSGPLGPSEDLKGQKYRKLAKNHQNWNFQNVQTKKFDPYISPMMITDPQMHENPPKKAEEHPKRAKYGQK